MPFRRIFNYFTWYPYNYSVPWNILDYNCIGTNYHIILNLYVTKNFCSC